MTTDRIQASVDMLANNHVVLSGVPLSRDNFIFATEAFKAGYAAALSTMTENEQEAWTEGVTHGHNAEGTLNQKLEAVPRLFTPDESGAPEDTQRLMTDAMAFARQEDKADHGATLTQLMIGRLVIALKRYRSQHRYYFTETVRLQAEIAALSTPADTEWGVQVTEAQVERYPSRERAEQGQRWNARNNYLSLNRLVRRDVGPWEPVPEGETRNATT